MPQEILVRVFNNDIRPARTTSVNYVMRQIAKSQRGFCWKKMSSARFPKTPACTTESWPMIRLIEAAIIFLRIDVQSVWPVNPAGGG